MILVDVNLLIYAHVINTDHHAVAREWLDAELNSVGRVGLPWQSLIGFVRVVTNPRIFPGPESVEDAWRQVEAWLDVPGVWIPQPADQHRAIIGRLLRENPSAGKLVPDAHLAALAIEHGLTLCSSDGDFARFRGLRWQNPLA